MFKYAIATGRAERNPAADLTGALEQPKIKHFSSITNPDQIGDLLRALHGYQGSVVTQAALKLAPLVFVRPGELRHAKWAEMDLDAGEWRYEVSKTRHPISSRCPLKRWRSYESCIRSLGAASTFSPANAQPAGPCQRTR